MHAYPPNPERQRADENTSLESLAAETDTSVHLVKQIYLEELTALERNAKVRTFVKVLAIKRTRQTLKGLDTKPAPIEVH